VVCKTGHPSLLVNSRVIPQKSLQATTLAAL